MPYPWGVLGTEDVEDTKGLGVIGIWSNQVQVYLRVPEGFKQSDLAMIVLTEVFLDVQCDQWEKAFTVGSDKVPCLGAW